MVWNRKWRSSLKVADVCFVLPPLFLASLKRLRKALQLSGLDIGGAIAKLIDFLKYPPELRYSHDIIGDINLIGFGEKCKCYLQETTNNHHVYFPTHSKHKGF